MLEMQHKYQTSSDEELLMLYRKHGRLEILGALYSRYMHLVFGVGLKYLGNREDAQDSVIQIFEKLIIELPKHEVKNFKSWLYVLTKNHCFMALRSGKGEKKRMEEWKSEQVFMESGEIMHPIDREDDALKDALNACIEKLKIEQKSCVKLFYYEKQSYKEIAEKMQLEEKKVKSLLQNGKRNLKICLESNNVR